ncbi:MAG TPA: bifunctional phosphoribosylaminoimidazolecarboxamide formyltransferase/IMP cyclohydrolase [Polyangiaceae bacterium]|nr:bifunctional phosphoribosylaminoimidazolecarboxamide formyltransferase/IMP cyclohydrolase [Polyangiaceae bacterium]
MPIRTAILSVSDKTGLMQFAKSLADRGITLISTGGTYSTLKAGGVPVESVESYTGSPEVMSGRVKTLHPRVHGGILARAGLDDVDLERLGGRAIDLVVVNLYPFEQTLAKPGTSFETLIENIDIGGPSMLRSAAKNHERVTVVCDPSDYRLVLDELSRETDVARGTRERLAAKAFAHTAAYDAAISGWLSARTETDGYPRFLTPTLEKAYSLRYGENPHQSGAFYRERNAPPGSLGCAESLGSGAKELSFNNLVDVDAALDAVREFENPAAVVVKHTNPCGVATAPMLADAYRAAREADPMSAFGGIVALNREVDDVTAEILAETFLECIIAPGFSPGALDRLRSKAALRLIATGEWLGPTHPARQFKRVSGGFVVQDRDATGAGEVEAGRVVTRRSPTQAELSSLAFAWCVCKHVKSNAIVLAAPGRSPGVYETIGIGGGQTARVTAVQTACEKAGERAQGSVLASDAFFPFPDNVQVAARAGIAAMAQPGGSKKDEDVIRAADEYGIAMIFTGVRHFRH